ncbi:MAG: hypothetical protein KJ042_06065 [Deltaproteobacteria bacterium]|nr:hypothetical protein [Deltaproteobacteria bacterium]
MIHKNYAPGITRVSAAELRGIADLLRTAMRPGLISLTNSALARPYKIGTTTIGVGAFTAGDSIVTGGAVCTAYVTDRIDLASAGGRCRRRRTTSTCACSARARRRTGSLRATPW